MEEKATGSRQCSDRGGRSTTATEATTWVAVVLAPGSDCWSKLLAEEIATVTGEERRQMGRWDGSSGKAWCTAVGDSDAAGEVGCGQAGEEGGALGRRGCNDGTSASARRQRKNRGEATLAVITEGWLQEKPVGASRMRQQGRQMTLLTEKGATLMVAAIDAGCCD
ncbi:hypothetical protein BHM03_00022686 [Ensete ventricosum]|nr:hypothetical protein BHM03_00022686 [Ensete ventricosum]